MEDGFEVYEDAPLLAASRMDQLFLVQLPPDFDVTRLKGIKLNMNKDHEDRVISLKDEHQTTLRYQREEMHDMDEMFRALVQDSLTDEIRLGQKFEGLITFSAVLSASVPTPVDEVNKLPIDHAYSKIPQVKGLHVHSAPIGSLSTVKQINQRNKRKASHTEETSAPKSAEKRAKGPEVVDLVDSEAKKDKKEKKDKKKKDHK